MKNEVDGVLILTQKKEGRSDKLRRIQQFASILHQLDTNTWCDLWEMNNSQTAPDIWLANKLQYVNQIIMIETAQGIEEDKVSNEAYYITKKLIQGNELDGYEVVVGYWSEKVPDFAADFDNFHLPYEFDKLFASVTGHKLDKKTQEFLSDEL